MHLHDADDPYGIVSTLMEALPSGGYLTLTHPSADFNPPAMAGLAAAAEQSGIPYVPRNRAGTERFSAGLDLVDPGVVRSWVGGRTSHRTTSTASTAGPAWPATLMATARKSVDSPVGEL